MLSRLLSVALFLPRPAPYARFQRAIMSSQDGSNGADPADRRSVGQVKVDNRAGRFGNPLGIRKGSDAMVDQRLREELVEKALKLCYDEQKVFAECAKKYGMAVIFMCREENKGMNSCLGQYTSDEALARYKLERQQAGVSELPQRKAPQKNVF